MKKAKRCLLDSNEVIQKQIKEATSFKNINADTFRLISEFLDLTGKSRLATTSAENNEALKAAKILGLVAQGKQTKAEALIAHQPNLLSLYSDVTDYSGRTFKNITAYEYAYWAKDWHMCRMLAAHMDEQTKAFTLSCCKKIEKYGLTYKQKLGMQVVEVLGSKHFDFTPLKNAYTYYLSEMSRWISGISSNSDIKTAWLAIGIAQRDVPAYVAQEYCHPNRSFHPTPKFDEPNLERSLTFSNFINVHEEPLFPIVISNTSGLGVDFTLIRSSPGTMWRLAMRWGGSGIATCARLDLAAINNLDAKSTIEIGISLDNLKPLEYSLNRATL